MCIICRINFRKEYLILFFSFFLAKGIYVIGFSYPVVPKGKARIRVQISASHSFEEVDYTVEAFKQIGKELGVIS